MMNIDRELKEMQGRMKLVGVRYVFDHLDVVAAGIKFKTDFVHNLLDQSDTQTSPGMFLQSLFRTFKFCRIKALTLITDRDGKFRGIGFNRDVNFFIFVVIVSMFDDIRAGFVDGQFNLADTVIIKSEFFRDAYDKIPSDLQIVRTARDIQCKYICRTFSHSKNLSDSSFGPRAAYAETLPEF